MEQKRTDVKNETFEAKTRKLTLIAKNTTMGILFSVDSRVGLQLLDKNMSLFQVYVNGEKMLWKTAVWCNFSSFVNGTKVILVFFQKQEFLEEEDHFQQTNKQQCVELLHRQEKCLFACNNVQHLGPSALCEM